MARNFIAYIEVPSHDVTASKRFYGSLFGWTFEDWGADYAAFSNVNIDGGFNGDGEHRTSAPLVILQTDDLEGMAGRIVEAGGTITLPIFAYPGGRRFHFRDPSGQELAMMQKD